MIAISKKKASPQFPKAKITYAVKAILPKENSFKVHVADSKIGKMKIVRVVTPAWKSLRPAERIGKVLDAVNGKLTAREQGGILRFSVLTPDEYDAVVKNSPTSVIKAPKSRKHSKAGESEARYAKGGIGHVEGDAGDKPGRELHIPRGWSDARHQKI